MPAFKNPLTTSELHSIRRMLDRRLNESHIPDIEITDDSVLGTAISWADRIVQDPDVYDTQAQRDSYRRAVKIRCASLLAGTLPQEVSTSAGGINENRERVGWVARVQKLERDSLIELGTIIQAGFGIPTESAANFKLFDVT